MVAQAGGDIRLVPFESVIGGIRGVTLDSDTVETARDIGICFGDEPIGTFLNRIVARAKDAVVAEPVAPVA